MQHFRNLKVWEKAHELTLQVYGATGDFPKSEMFGLAAHLRKTALSIGSNLAEGCGRGSDADFKRFVQIANGSLYELDYQLLLARDLNYLHPEMYANMESRLVEVRRMMLSLLQRLSESNS